MLQFTASALVLASTLSVAQAQGSRVVCVVDDPTRTPLNIRNAPRDGTIVGTVTNGTRLQLLERREDSRGVGWSYVRRASGGPNLGWVFAEYLICQRE
jgi:hypothetical protein